MSPIPHTFHKSLSLGRREGGGRWREEGTGEDDLVLLGVLLGFFLRTSHTNVVVTANLDWGQRYTDMRFV